MGGGDVTDEGVDSSNDVGEEVMVKICGSNGSKFAVHVDLNATVEFFKSVIAQKCEIPTQQQRLIYRGRILKDDQTLASYGLEADHTVHLVRGFTTAAPADGATTTDGGVRNTNSIPTTDDGSNEGVPLGGSGFGSSLFPGIGFTLPGMEHMQRMVVQNPNMIRDILSMPIVRNLVNNPETIRSMIRINPQIREIMDRELAHIVNDPATIRQTLEAARNPEIMREMVRNTDRTMSNIASSRDGFNMLRRMYENVWGPFLNATILTGNNRSVFGSNPAAPLGARDGRPGRENSINSPTPGLDTTINSPVRNTNPLPIPWASAGAGGMRTNSGSLFNPLGNVRSGSAGGLGGRGFMMGSMADLTSSLMQNPTFPQILRNRSQNMNQIRGLNPQLQNMLDSNPQIRDMMQNPEFIRQLTSPEMMQQLLSFYRDLSSQVVSQISQEPGQNDGRTVAGAASNMGLDTLINLFGALRTGGGITTPNRPQVPPEEMYATQLSQLQEMGFIDTQENIRALIATAGNVHAAVERLIGIRMTWI